MSDPVDDYFKNIFFDALGKGTASPSVLMAPEFERNHGVKYGPNLKAFVEFRDGLESNFRRVGEWRVWREDAWVPDPARNRFEQLVQVHQNHFLSTVLMEQFTWLVRLGTAGNGDVYFAAIQGEDEDTVPVAFFDHSSRKLWFMADSLPCLAWANRCLQRMQDVEGDSESEATILQEMRQIERRFSPSWHYGALSAVPCSVPDDLGGKTRQLWVASRWIQLWLGFDLHAAQSVEWFRHTQKLQDSLKHQWDDCVEGRVIERVAPWALYWLWRSYLFGETAILESTLDRTRQHRSPVVADAAALLDEIRSGRKTLGHISDIASYRESFLRSLTGEGDSATLEELRLGDRAMAEIEARHAAMFEAKQKENAAKNALVWSVSMDTPGPRLATMKVLRAHCGLTMVDAKHRIDNTPILVLEGVRRARADEVVTALETVGATVTMEER